jgi:hypothetical protein
MVNAGCPRLLPRRPIDSLDEAFFLSVGVVRVGGTQWEAHMKKRSNTRQSAQDKTVIDHLTSGSMKPDMGKGHEDHHFTKRDGRKLEKAIHKDWTPDKGGLPGP